MITQFVPSDTSVAHAPTLAARIAVPGVALPIGATLLDADTNVWACKFLNVTARPVHEDAMGKVTVQVDPDLLLITHASEGASPKSAILVAIVGRVFKPVPPFSMGKIPVT
jgi:hypothetical protein